MEILGVIALVLLYLLPSVVASYRRHPSESAIAMMNLLLGWTALFWLWSLFWALSGEPGKKPEAARRITRDNAAGKWQCPWCFGEIDPRAVACPHCRNLTEAVR